MLLLGQPFYETFCDESYDTIWLATEPMDMHAGTETALARVIVMFGAAHPHCAYLFANRRANRMKVLVHDGFGI